MTEPRRAPVIPLRRTPDGVPLEARDDDALMALAASEHRRAFEVLATRHLPRLAGYCAKLLGAGRAGEEMAQDVLVEAWTRRHRYRPEGRFVVFLITMARSRCLNRLRDERRRQGLAPAPAEDAEEPEAADAVDAEALSTEAGQLEDLLERECARQARAAILALSPTLREALLLRYDHDLEYSEIARIVGRREGAVRARVFLALKKLRAALAAPEAP